MSAKRLAQYLAQFKVNKGQLLLLLFLLLLLLLTFPLLLTIHTCVRTKFKRTDYTPDEVAPGLKLNNLESWNRGGIHDNIKLTWKGGGGSHHV